MVQIVRFNNRISESEIMAILKSRVYTKCVICVMCVKSVFFLKRGALCVLMCVFFTQSVLYAFLFMAPLVTLHFSGVDHLEI